MGPFALQRPRGEQRHRCASLAHVRLPSVAGSLLLLWLAAGLTLGSGFQQRRRSGLSHNDEV